MKLNWGHYILISFVLFVTLMLYMVFKSYQHNIDLVSEDYYAKEIKFQDVIEKKTNAANLKEDVIWESLDGGVLLTFPQLDEEIRGEIVLFRPSDKKLDMSFEIRVGEENQQYLIHSELAHGKYIIQIDWKSGTTEYYTEGTAYVIK